MKLTRAQEKQIAAAPPVVQPQKPRNSKKTGTGTGKPGERRQRTGSGKDGDGKDTDRKGKSKQKKDDEAKPEPDADGWIAVPSTRPAPTKGKKTGGRRTDKDRGDKDRQGDNKDRRRSDSESKPAEKAPEPSVTTERTKSVATANLFDLLDGDDEDRSKSVLAAVAPAKKPVNKTQTPAPSNKAPRTNNKPANHRSKQSQTYEKAEAPAEESKDSENGWGLIQVRRVKKLGKPNPVKTATA